MVTLGSLSRPTTRSLTGEAHHLHGAAALLQRLDQFLTLRRFSSLVDSFQHDERSSFTRHDCC